MSDSLRFQLLTASGPAAIAIVRVRGAAAREFLARHIRLTTRTGFTSGAVRRGALLDGDGEPMDDILISVHASDPLDVRLHLHGSPWIMRRLVELLEAFGGEHDTNQDRSDCARELAESSVWLAESRLSADAQALLPKMSTLAGACWLLNQPDAWRKWFGTLSQLVTIGEARRELTCVLARADWIDWFATPTRIVLAGPPNAGKSTLANALADRQVSLVSEIPGTTRDWVESPGEVGGYPVVWIDTAGLRVSGDELEAAGIERTMCLVRNADAVVVVLDHSVGGRDDRTRFMDAYAALVPSLLVLNKCDLPPDPGQAVLHTRAWPGSPSVQVSARDRIGLQDLHESMLTAFGRPPPALLAGPSPFAARYRDALTSALHSGTLSNMLEIVRNMLL